MKKLSASVLALCLGLGTTVHAEPTTTRFVQKGPSASGSATIDDPTNCMHGLIGIHAAEETTKDGTGTTTTRLVLGGFGGFDSCLQTNFGPEQTSFPLTMPIGAQTFTFNANIPIHVVITDGEHGNDPGRTVQFTATITITAVPGGELEKSRATTVSKLGTHKTVVRSRGLSRQATFTVTNAMFDGKPVNFAVGDADIGTTRKATIDITRE